MLVLATCPEWSKGVHLRCTVFVRVGSNPTVAKYNKAFVAQWLAHLPSKQGVAGSNPAKGKPGEAK